MDNACYHSAQNFLYSGLWSKNVKVRIYKTKILPAILYACETRSLTLREGHIVRVFEKRALRIIFGPKRNEMVQGWRKLYKEELHSLHQSPFIIRMTSQGG
jgi:hypothetical protein